MKSEKKTVKRKGGQISRNFRKIMTCLSSGQQLRTADELIPSSGSLATNDYAVSGCSSQAGETCNKSNIGNIEEAESSLRESGFLNYEEARALLGRYEYHKGNIEAALHVFEGIDIRAITPKMKITLAKRGAHGNRPSNKYAAPPMSIHAVSLLLEAVFLKSKSLQLLGRFKDAAHSCKVILDIVESSLPEGLPENFNAECKLQETLNKVVELLPELWKLADCPYEASMSYRRALLHRWNLDTEVTANIQKEFAVFLLYSGGEASPPNLRSQMDSSFVPRNNIEEAILLLMILVRKMSTKKINWDPSIMDHLSYALSIAGDLRSLANQFEQLLPGVIDRKEMYHLLALCYYGAGEDLVALNLERKLLSSREDPDCVPALLMASKICGESPNLSQEGVNFARRALNNLDGKCDQLESLASFLLGISLSANSESCVSDSERLKAQSEALHALETATRVTKLKDSTMIYHLSLEYSEQRKLDNALYYAKCLLKVEAGSNIKGWLLLARILSAQRRFSDAETIVNAALDQTGKWDQADLLRTKAKLQLAQNQFRSAIETYTQLLGLLKVQNKTFGAGKKLDKERRDRDQIGSLEMEIWHDLAYIYIELSQWQDAEICLSKSKPLKSHLAFRCHVTGTLYEAKGLHREALRAFTAALDMDPGHVPSLVSTAVALRRLGSQSHDLIRSFLTDALRRDRRNVSAWYNLGLTCKDQSSPSSLLEATECFEAATFLQETEPIEPFR